jgi:hypothetical protein
MKLSETVISGPLYSIIAVYLPFSVIFSFVPLCAVILSAIVPSLSFPYPALLLPGMASGLAASFYYSLLKHSQTDHSAANIRGAIIAMVLSYIAASLLRFDMPLGGRFFPAAANIIAPFISLYVWASVLVIKEMFRARERLEASTALYQGDKLRQEMLDDSNLLSTADKLIVKTRLVYIVQLIFITAVAVVCTVLKMPLSPAFFIWLILILMISAAVCGLLGLFRREHYYAGEGIAASVSDRSRGMFGMLLFSLAAAGTAILLALGKNILPLSIITGFLAWLSGLVKPAPQVERPIEAPPEVPASPLGMVDLSALMGDTGPAEPWPFWKWLQYGVIGLMVLAFLWFMVKPLLFRDQAEAGRLPLGKKLFFLIAEWLKSLRTLGALFFRALRGGASVKIRKPDAAELRRMSSDLLAAYSPQKRREMRQSATLFARLILWGSQTRRVPWKPAHAPGEYCALLAAGLPPGDDSAEAAALPRAILRCGALFEQSLYAATVLSAAERQEFKRLVNEITASG